MHTWVEFYHSERFIPQLFGLLSFILGAICFAQKDDRRFKLFMMIMNVNHTLHFILMGAATSALSALLAAIRTYVAIKVKSLYVAIFFIVLIIVLNSFLASEWFDWLCVVGACLGTYALFCLHGIQLRLVMMLGTLCWLTNNIIIGSIGGVMLEVMVLTISMITVIRLKKQSLKV